MNQWFWSYISRTRTQRTHTSVNRTKKYSVPIHSGVCVLWEQGRLDEFLLVSAVAVWWVSGVLAATQPSFGVLLRDEAWGIRPWALVLWVPSQKGCFLLCPQVHHEWRFPPTSSTLKGFLEAMTGSLDRLESWTFGAVIIGHVQGCIKVAETNLRTLSDMIVFMFGCGCVLLIK